LDVLFGQQRPQLVPADGQVAKSFAGGGPYGDDSLVDVETVGRDRVHVGPPLP